MSEFDLPLNECTYPTLTLADIAEDLPKIKKALILCHVNPDGDTVGSACALRELILALGGEADVRCPMEIPKRLKFLLGDRAENTADNSVPELSEYDRVIAVDVASPAQLGTFADFSEKIDYMIDHHGTGEPFAPYYVDPMAAAAGEIIFGLARELRKNGKIGDVPSAARAMYAAIVSDTGSFKFSNTTPETHRVAAELVAEIGRADDGGADTADICRSLFGQRTLGELTAQMVSIQNLRFFEDGKLGVVLFTQQMLRDVGLSEEEIGNVVETPRCVEGVLVGISLRQSSADPTVYKVSSRANGDIDVAAVCAAFGGGGHTRAAGCTIVADTPEAALAMAAEAFGAAIRDYGSRGV